HYRTLHSFPTRRSSDLNQSLVITSEISSNFKQRRPISSAGDQRRCSHLSPLSEKSSTNHRSCGKPTVVCTAGVPGSRRRSPPLRSEEHTSELQSRFDLV